MSVSHSSALRLWYSRWSKWLQSELRPNRHSDPSNASWSTESSNLTTTSLHLSPNSSTLMCCGFVGQQVVGLCTTSCTAFCGFFVGLWFAWYQLVVQLLVDLLYNSLYDFLCNKFTATRSKWSLGLKANHACERLSSVQWIETELLKW